MLKNNVMPSKKELENAFPKIIGKLFRVSLNGIIANMEDKYEDYQVLQDVVVYTNSSCTDGFGIILTSHENKVSYELINISDFTDKNSDRYVSSISELLEVIENGNWAYEGLHLMGFSDFEKIKEAFYEQLKERKLTECEISNQKEPNYPLREEFKCPHCHKYDLDNREPIAMYETPQDKEDNESRWQEGDPGYDWTEDRRCKSCGELYSMRNSC